MKVINLGTNKSNISSYISSSLLKEINKNIEEGKKVLLYLNKRGEFSSLICKKCQKIYKCKNCDCCLTVHKPDNLVCHICLYSKNVPLKCDDCNSNELNRVGIGTQLLEDQIKKNFNQKKVFRFDSDTTKTMKEKKDALYNIENADIIIGTKMITTGFNIKNLGLIGVILLEQELQIPKYDTEEKVYQNISQLIGRGNRNGEKTDIIIQSFIPDNKIIKSITIGNYKDFLLETIKERKKFNYPPYIDIATIEYKNKDKEKSLIFIKKVREKLEKEKNSKLIEIILIEKVMKKYNSYFSKIIIKGKNLRKFLACVKKDILNNSELNIVFEN